MSINVAVRVRLASSPPLHSFFHHCKERYSPPGAPLRPCLASVTTATVSAACRESGGPVRRHQKRVVFADSQGLALATVHVLEEDELQFQLTQIEGAATRLQLEDAADSEDSGPDLVLDFTPPAADYLDLRNRLKVQQVCLETCSVQDRLLSGTVQVRNIGFEKSVWVRISFDSWCSFQDFECDHLDPVFTSPEIDTFSFSIQVPPPLRTGNHIQFCVRFQTQDQTFWDNNGGNNYQLVAAGLSEEVSGALKIHIREDRRDLDPFGSPRTSAGIFPQWQSQGPIETSTPYW